MILILDIYNNILKISKMSEDKVIFKEKDEVYV